MFIDPDFLRRELDSRFLQSSIGTPPTSSSSGSSGSGGGNVQSSMPPPLQFNPMHNAMPRNIPTSNEKLVSSNSSSKQQNEKLAMQNLTPEQHHQNMLMNQILRNNVCFFFFLHNFKSAHLVCLSFQSL